MELRVIVILTALLAVAPAKVPDVDRTQIFQDQQEEEEEVQPNSAQQDLGGEEEVQPNSAQQESEATTADDAPQCGFLRVHGCILHLRSIKGDWTTKEACEVQRFVYNCLKDTCDSCPEHRVWLQPNMIIAKRNTDTNCYFYNAVAPAKDPDVDLTKIFQNQQEEEEQVQPNSIQQDTSRDLTQIIESGEEEVQQSSIEQESEATTADDAPQCEYLRVGRCLSYVKTIKDDVMTKEACEPLRLVYNCLKDVTDSCLQHREWLQPKLNRIKSNMNAHCDFDNEEKVEERKCINSLMLDLKACVHVSLIQTLFKLKKTAKNNISRFRCMSYDAIVDCQTSKILANCGKEEADNFYDYMADLPDVIQQACDVVNALQEEDI